MDTTDNRPLLALVVVKAIESVKWSDIWTVLGSGERCKWVKLLYASPRASEQMACSLPLSLGMLGTLL